MEIPNEIIVKTESYNLWWGIYGLCEKTGWEDIVLFDDKGFRIGGLCLHTKNYLREALKDFDTIYDNNKLKKDIKNHLAGNTLSYRYFYFDSVEDEDFFEVPYDAPRNDNGIKPNYIEIWHTDEGIDLNTIEDTVKKFAEKFLNTHECKITIECNVTLEKAIETFKNEQEIWGI